MSVNLNPIYPITPVTTFGLVSAAMASSKQYDGTDATANAMAKVMTAGANGNRVDFLKVKIGSTAGGTPSGSTTATMLRVWINNGSVQTTSTNNTLISELAIPVTAVSATVATPEYVLPINIWLPATYTIWVGLTVAIGATAAAVAVTAVGGDA